MAYPPAPQKNRAKGGTACSRSFNFASEMGEDKEMRGHCPRWTRGERVGGEGIPGVVGVGEKTGSVFVGEPILRVLQAGDLALAQSRLGWGATSSGKPGRERAFFDPTDGNVEKQRLKKNILGAGGTRGKREMTFQARALGGSSGPGGKNFKGWAVRKGGGGCPQKPPPRDRV